MLIIRQDNMVPLHYSPLRVSPPRTLICEEITDSPYRTVGSGHVEDIISLTGTDVTSDTEPLCDSPRLCPWVVKFPGFSSWDHWGVKPHQISGLQWITRAPPVLAFPDHSKPYILDSDASDGGIGGVLSQKQYDGLEKVITYREQSIVQN